MDTTPVFKMTFDQDAHCFNPRTERVRCNILRLHSGMSPRVHEGWSDTAYTCADAAILFRDRAGQASYLAEAEAFKARAEMLKFFGNAPCPPALIEEWPGIFKP